MNYKLICQKKRSVKPPCISLPENIYERGWLFETLVELEGACNGRWPYLINIHQKRVLEAPIPQLFFDTFPQQHIIKNIQKSLECLSFYWDGIDYSRVIEDFVEGLLFAFGEPNAKLSDKYSEEKWRNAFLNLNLKEILFRPHDYFGSLLEERKYGQWSAFYRTPMQVCTMMAEVTMRGCNPLESVGDPCCGTGVMLLAGSNHSLFLYGADINHLLTRVAALNMFLYAPWGVYPPNFLRVEH